MITFTLDLEDHRPNSRYEKRYPEITRHILELLDQNLIKGTFFIVGTISKNDPDLIKEISNEGHELAFHSYAHKQLQNEDQSRFRQDTDKGKKELEDISGKKIIGFRAPVFSLTSKTLWVLDILQDLEFKYSSSVLPARSPLNGFPNAPKSPFYWPNGLLEIPVPVTNVGPFVVPFLGGVYLRYLPITAIKYFINKSSNQCLWTYCHPYDFDPDEPFFRIKDAGLLTSLILWFNRNNTKEKMISLLSNSKSHNSSKSFAEQYNSGVFKQSPVFEL